MGRLTGNPIAADFKTVHVKDWEALKKARRGELKFTVPLTGITAAVVGVIINLAVFFAWHTFWPQAVKGDPFIGTFEWFPVVVAIAHSSPCGNTRLTS